MVKGDALLSFSGGLDSTVLLSSLLREGRHVTCVSYKYGSHHNKLELKAAKTIYDYYSTLFPGKIEKMELKASRKGDPMVSIWFRILAGEFKNSLIFMNQVINIPFQVSIANKILSGLTPDLEVKFETYSQYGNMIMDIFEEIDSKYEYAIRYGENKGFPTFEILDVFEL